MGFFDFLAPVLEIAAPILGAITGVPVTGQAQVAAAQAGAAQVMITDPALSLRTGAEQQAILAGRAGGGLRRRTIIETFNPTTNVVVRKEIHAGGVAVFQSDVTAANRLNRALRRLNKKQPKKLIRQTPISALKDEVIESALRASRDFPHGHGSVVHCPS